jgi:hypothetical protein
MNERARTTRCPNATRRDSVRRDSKIF